MSFTYRFELPNPSELEDMEYPTSCYNCNENCDGAYLICRGEVEL